MKNDARRYELLAQLYRPTDREIMAKEVRRLAACGLKPVDISVALRLDLSQVREILAKEGT